MLQSCRDLLAFRSSFLLEHISLEILIQSKWCAQIFLPCFQQTVNINVCSLALQVSVGGKQVQNAIPFLWTSFLPVILI